MNTLLIFILLFYFKFSLQNEPINGHCDDSKCSKLCLNQHGYLIKETLTYIKIESKCEYYSYCSCFKDNFKIRLN